MCAYQRTKENATIQQVCKDFWWFSLCSPSLPPSLPPSLNPFYFLQDTTPTEATKEPLTIQDSKDQHSHPLQPHRRSRKKSSILLAFQKVTVCMSSCMALCSKDSTQQDPIKEPVLKMLPSEDDILQKRAVSSFLDILENPSHNCNYTSLYTHKLHGRLSHKEAETQH